MFFPLYGGCHTRHSAPFQMSRPNGLDHYVLLLIKTPSEFHIDQEKVISQPDSAVIIAPHTPYHYSSLQEVYINDWLHFSCSPEDFPHRESFPLNTIFPLNNLSRFTTFIQQILWEKNYASEEYQKENGDLLFHVLMNNLYSAFNEQNLSGKYNPYQTKLRKLRLTLQAEPYKQFQLKEIAGQMGISPSYFQHLYSDTFGKSFRSDLISMRIEYAKELIQNTNLTMEQIAEQSGYSNEVHFYRQFQKETGFTPATFRKMKY